MSEGTQAEIRRVFEMFRPRHVVAVHPDQADALDEYTRGYDVEIISSDLVPRGKVFLIDRKALGGDGKGSAASPPGDSIGSVIPGNSREQEFTDHEGLD